MSEKWNGAGPRLLGALECACRLLESAGLDDRVGYELAKYEIARAKGEIN